MFAPQLTRRRLQQFIGRAVEAVRGIDPNADEEALRQLEQALGSEAGDVLDKGRSTLESQDRVRKALLQAEAEEWLPIVDWFSEAVVYERGEKLYLREFTISDEGDIELGEPKHVERVYRTVDEKAGAEEAQGEFEILVASEAEGAGNVLLKIIRPGQGSSGLWTSEVLKRDGPGVFRKGTHMHADHPTASEERERPERSVQTLIGTLEEDATFQANGPAGAGLYAKAKIAEPFLSKVKEFKNDIGVSLRAMVRKTDGAISEIIDSPITSVDVVTKPGAGGQIVSAFESAFGLEARRGEQQWKNPPNRSEEKMDAETKQALDGLSSQVATLAESVNKIAEGQTKLAGDVAAAENRTFQSDVRAAAREAVKTAELPDAAKTRVVEAIVRGATRNDKGELDQEKFAAAAKDAIVAESDYVKALSGPGKVTGNGGQASGGDDLKAAQEAMKQSYLEMGYDEKVAAQMAQGVN